MPTAIDFETSYSKERSIQTLGTYNYLRHPETEIYMLSVWSPELQWVGHPSSFNWDLLQGQELLSHNAAFDSQVAAVCGPDLTLEAWHCTANLAAYRQSPRSLNDAAQQLLGIAVDKSTRDMMKGKQYRDLTPEQQQQVRNYALKDSETCYRLWETQSEHWPEFERRLSAHTMAMCARGIGVNTEAVEQGIRHLSIERETCERQIPWADGETPVTSPKALALECRRLGIEPPASTDIKSEVFDWWASQYEDAVPMVKAVQKWRSINRTIELLKAVQARTNGDTLYYDLAYGGAPHTLRWAGGSGERKEVSGLNMQNWPKKDVCGVNVRHMLVPRKGNKFIVADFAQIEARVLLWLVNDRKMLEQIRGGVDIYEAHARATMGYSDPRPMKEGNPNGRQLAKVRVLQLGYGSGWKKFQATYAQWNPGKHLTDKQAEANVKDFRSKNPKVIELWRKLERGCRASKGESFVLRLPSGRAIEYFDIGEYEGELSGRNRRGGNRTNLYGGKLAENLCQATARDIMATALLELEDAGLPVVMHTHDEVVVEAPANALEEVKQIMSRSPEWASDCPVAVDASVCDRYEKK